MAAINNQNNQSISFRYKFSFENGLSKEFVVKLNKKTLQLEAPVPTDPPAWTQLHVNKCPNCPLNEQTHPHCPIALNISELVDSFKDLISFEKTYMTIEQGNRTFIGKVSLQEGIKSLIGIYMVSSGCPVMDKLRPMARVHVPFPTMDESLYKILSMYFLAQYVRHKDGKQVDWDLKGLLNICNDVQIVNRSFFKRIKEQKVRDASLNAIVALDSFATYMASALEDDNLNEIKVLFNMYL